MNHLSATRRTLRLSVPPNVGTDVVDVSFDGHRVWSTKLPAAHGRLPLRFLSWPDALRPHLSGRSFVEVAYSADGGLVASRDVRFGGTGRVEITDSQGRWLAVNKWERLGPVLEGADSGVGKRLLANARGLVDLLEAHDYPVYIVGGTLLGAMRGGGLLPHDDDIDLAFWSAETDPFALARVSFEMERLLVAHGYVPIRLSHAHLQVTFFAENGATDHYVDIFTGFHDEDGEYNQPFALRGALDLDTLLPTKPLDLDGTPLPAPAVPEAWLEFAYGPSWRVPDPSFKFVTPRATRRRFDNYFGVFNRQRVFWEKHYAGVEERPPATGGEDAVAELCALLPERSFVIDLGCGDGRLTEMIAAAGHRVLGLDYSYEALRVARLTQPENVEYRYLNFNDRHSLVSFGLDLLDRGEQPYFFAHNLLHEMPRMGRGDLAIFLAGVLDAQTFAYTTFSTDQIEREAQNPETWRLTLNGLRTQLRPLGLTTHVVRSHTQETSAGTRQALTALIWR